MVPDGYQLNLLPHDGSEIVAHVYTGSARHQESVYVDDGETAIFSRSNPLAVRLIYAGLGFGDSNEVSLYTEGSLTNRPNYTVNMPLEELAGYTLKPVIDEEYEGL